MLSIVVFILFIFVTIFALSISLFYENNANASSAINNKVKLI